MGSSDSKPQVTITEQISSQELDSIIRQLNGLSDHAPDTDQPLNNFLIALYSFDSRADTELTIKKGDILYLLTGSKEDWCRVRKQESGQIGCVPKTFVARLKTLEAEEWFVGKISRKQATHLLSLASSATGTFLIRERKERAAEYALTVKDDRKVKHYLIQQDEKNKFYLNSNLLFPSLNELIYHYAEKADGICCRLTLPASKADLPDDGANLYTDDSRQISANELKWRTKLGAGQFGEVWKGVWREIVDVAIKMVKEDKMSREDFHREAEVMKHLDHPNLVRLYGVCKKEYVFYIVMEYLKNGSLLEYLREEKNKISEDMMMGMSAQIVDAMKYLDDNRLVHRDLGARNILVGETINGIPIVKVADFGMARKLMEENVYKPQNKLLCPIKWTAPEVFNTKEFTIKSDVWSFGILLWEIFSYGKAPYGVWNGWKALEEVNRGYRMEQPERCPDNVYYDIILQCWKKDPDCRPTFVELSSHFDKYYTYSGDYYAGANE